MEFQIGPARVRVTCRDRATLMTEVGRRLGTGRGFTLATLNVDHLEKLRRDPAFARAYAAHDLVVADGNPVVWLAALSGERLELVPGSELVTPLVSAAAAQDLSVALIAGSQKAADLAAEALQRKMPGLQVALRTAPGFPFDPDGPEAEALIGRLRESGARLCLLGVGAPRQERFAARASAALPQVGFASVGAGLDFVAGLQRRAPKAFRRARMEWVWRALSSPRRLGPRYLKGAAILPGLALWAWRRKRRDALSSPR